MTLEHKFCEVSKTLTVKNGTEISGYASLFGQSDQSGDRVSKGAYDVSLAKIKTAGGSVKMLWQHDPTEPIGVWDEVRADAKGLWVKGRILPDVARGREAAALIEAGAIDGLSIGYRTIKSKKASNGGRELDELELWEVSLVTFPMLTDARVAAKAEDPADTTLRDLATIFRQAQSALRQH